MPRYRIWGPGGFHDVTSPYSSVEEYQRNIAAGWEVEKMLNGGGDVSMTFMPPQGPLPTIAGGALGGLFGAALEAWIKSRGGSGQGQPSPAQQMPMPPGGGYLPTRVAGMRGYYNREGRWIDRRRPRMNPLNARALRRAMRRVSSFARIARATISFTKRVKMKKKRGKR